MTKQTLRQPTMLLYLERLSFSRPLAREVCPAKSQRHQSEEFFQSLVVREMALFQTEAPGFERPEERFNLPPQSVVAQYLVTLRTTCDNHIFTRRGSHTHHRHGFAQDLSLATEQHPDSGFLRAKQILGTHHFSRARVGNQEVLFEAQAKRNLRPTKIEELFFANKFAVCRHKSNAFLTKQFDIVGVTQLKSECKTDLPNN